jgi:hypothetical protein
MELRKHPRMTYMGRLNWPPEWRGPYGPENPLPNGEVGILLRAETSNILSTPHCVVVIEWNGREYFGFLHFDEENFAHEFIRLLQNWLGRSIAEVGSLQMP